MPAPKPAKSPLEEMKSLRDTFAKNSAKAEQEAAELEACARAARSEANALRKQSEVMERAMFLYLANEQEKVTAVQIETLGKKETARISDRNFIFLIDGSGSMTGGPLENALDASAKIIGKLEEKAGARPAASTWLFGDRTPVAVDMTDEDSMQRARRGLNCGTDLAPSLDMLVGTLDPNKAVHLVVVSDGDLFDCEKSREVMVKLLAKNPKSTVDLVIIKHDSGGYGDFRGYGDQSIRKTPMENLVEAVGADVSTPRIPRTLATQPQGVAAAVTSLLAARLKEAQPRKPKNPAPGK
jgi:hypothetical protein